MNATVPLEEALPWSPETRRVIMICDSIQTDGRFLLHTLAHQIFRHKSATSVGGAPSSTTSTNARLWWITGSPVTDRQVATGLKKLGCDVAASYLRAKPSVENVTAQPLTITSLAIEISNKVLEDDSFNMETYLRQTYQSIKTWAAETTENDNSTIMKWLFLDDVSALTSLLGESIIFQFVDSLCSLAVRSSAFGLVLRCSSDLDQTLVQVSQLDDAKDKTGWIGAGGLAHRRQLQYDRQEYIPWERNLETVDAIIDVVPLTSGHSREAHGRLIFSEYPGGRGWRDATKTTTATITPSSQGVTWNKSLMNYCIQDNGVRAIRLRENAAIR